MTASEDTERGIKVLEAIFIIIETVAITILFVIEMVEWYWSIFLATLWIAVFSYLYSQMKGDSHG